MITRKKIKNGFLLLLLLLNFMGVIFAGSITVAAEPPAAEPLSEGDNSGSIHNENPVDWWFFEVNVPSEFQVSLTNLFENLDLYLYLWDDVTDDLILVDSSTESGSNPEIINYEHTGNYAVYYVEVIQVGNAHSSYQLDLSFHTPERLVDLWHDGHITSENMEDWYYFELYHRNTIALRLQYLQDNLDLHLYRWDDWNKQLVLVAVSEEPGNSDEFIEYEHTDDYGMYYVHIYSVGGAESYYDLNFDLEAKPLLEGNNWGHITVNNQEDLWYFEVDESSVINLYMYNMYNDLDLFLYEWDETQEKLVELVSSENRGISDEIIVYEHTEDYAFFYVRVVPHGGVESDYDLNLELRMLFTWGINGGDSFTWDFVHTEENHEVVGNITLSINDIVLGDVDSTVSSEASGDLDELGYTTDWGEETFLITESGFIVYEHFFLIQSYQMMKESAQMEGIVWEVGDELVFEEGKIKGNGVIEYVDLPHLSLTLRVEEPESQTEPEDSERETESLDDLDLFAISGFPIVPLVVSFTLMALALTKKRQF